MQVDPIKPTLKAPGTERLKLKYEELLSNFGFKFKLRRYIEADVGETDQLLARQAGIINQLMGDAAPAAGPHPPPSSSPSPQL